MDTMLTTCPFCACGCALYLQAERGKAVGVAPSRHHPITQGRLCARGWGAHEAPAWGERLTRPLLRRNDALAPVTWSEALDAAAAGLAAARAAGKAVGVLGSARATNEENYLAARLARGALGSGHIDSSLRATYLPLASGIASASSWRAPCGTLEDVERSDVVVVFDGDLARSHPRAAFAVMRAVERGARLVTISRLRTQLARLATRQIATLPGGETDVAEGLVEALRDGSREELRDVAGWYAQAERASILVAPEAVLGNRGEQLGAALGRLAGAAGHLGRPGSALLPLPARWNLRGACEMGAVPDLLPGGFLLDDEGARRRLAGLWGRAPAIEVGRDAPSIAEQVGALVVVADDLVGSLRDAVRTRTALDAIECLVVLDAFMSPTARAAHVVLPIASFAENEGTATSADGRVQRVRPVAEPPGSARPGWRVLADLSTRVGLASGFESADDVMEEIGRAAPAYGGLDRRALNQAWGVLVQFDGKAGRPPLPQREGSSPRPAPGTRLLALDGVMDWGADPLVASAPTLCREHLARRKLFPNGLVEMSASDAEALGVRAGWMVRVTSAQGSATLPAVLRRELPQGLLLVPFAFRGSAAGVLGGLDVIAVQVEPA